ncbi:Fpg/Nei family DNA glycosylase [Streptomyces sp. XD-27]|uniref:Fpg/Nei family DNA glycosylase n=1 Tax=Streptomyces sp. XD-27 TaxID=3062779 RepID=UPI0026F4310D|nr:DNA-formamidopyrimidine glycosylase family protein [Streptomyces sp. XD-27]WKX73664.1 DNA-formamidopyrimidine glycosylase family protein [Streptomyces sp. XD-27]
MPELPDVEGYRRVLDSCGRGRRVTRVERADPGVLRAVSARRLRRALEGRRLREPERLGKWLIARTDGPAVLLHFGMTGELLCCSADDPGHRHDRVVLTLDDDHQLRYRDQRKLQGLRLADSEADIERVTARLGPDALAVDGETFASLLAGRRARVKTVLTDQSALAGLGNLLADEILWRAGIPPGRPAKALDEDERRRLYREMRGVLRSSVRAGRVPDRPSWLTGRRDAPDPACPRCDGPLRRTRIGGRGTVWCPRCQPDDGR